MSLMLQAHLLDKYGPRLSTEQLARVLGIAHKTLLNRFTRGQVPIATYREGGKRWASADAVAEYLEECAEQAKKNPDAEVRVSMPRVEATQQP